MPKSQRTKEPPADSGGVDLDIIDIDRLRHELLPPKFRDRAMLSEKEVAEIGGPAVGALQADRAAGRGLRYVKFNPSRRGSVRYLVPDLLRLLVQHMRHPTAELFPRITESYASLPTSDPGSNKRSAEARSEEATGQGDD